MVLGLIHPWNTAAAPCPSTLQQNKAPESCRAGSGPHTPVAPLHTHRNAVVQLQTSDIAKSEDDACSIGPADAFS